jgi:hypothetical protein
VCVCVCVSISNFLDESQKIAAREARPGATRELFFRARWGQFQSQQINFDFTRSFHNWLPKNGVSFFSKKACSR